MYSQNLYYTTTLAQIILCKRNRQSIELVTKISQIYKFINITIYIYKTVQRKL